MELALVLVGVIAAGLGATALLVRSGVRRTRKAVEPMRVRALGWQKVMSPASAPRADLAADVLRARQAFELARRDGRPVKELEPTLKGLERVARSLESDLRLDPRSHADEVARTRQAAASLVDACRPAPARQALLDDVTDAAERARLTAQARRELT